MIFESYQVSIHNFSSQNILIPNHELNWIDEFFCGMVDWQKAFSLISSWGHCQRSSPSRISNTPRAGFEPAQNLSSGFSERCVILITSTNFAFFHNWTYNLVSAIWGVDTCNVESYTMGGTFVLKLIKP